MNFDGDSSQLPTWRLWGEERSEGAIYTVYLKKVRYHRPSKSISDSEDEISHLEWETVRVRLVKAGTLEKLVESLASDSGELESTYVNVFLATYRTFTTAQQVLGLIRRRYEDLLKEDPTLDPIIEQLTKTYRSVLHVWIDAFPEDFKDPPSFRLLREVLAFCQQFAADSDLHFKVKHRLERFVKLSSESDKTQNTQSNHMYVNGGTFSNETSSAAVQSFLDLPEKHIAEQLTKLDTELFKRVIPHQCLGAVWSRRDRDRSKSSKGSSRNSEAYSVQATVEQFNAVSLRVISTVLMDAELRATQRAKIIAKWIDVAQELRVLKNFSSLKAIISALQSNPVYRLKHVWLAVPKEKVELYEELARIFSEENNQSAQRELLMKEGTAKFAESVGENDRHLQKILLRQAPNCGVISHGTIPYLGTFLTDLTMIDTAIPDFVGDGLINFDKRRKEFEVLAQIKLFQGAANSYQIESDSKFQRWFDSLPVYEDRESFDLSCLIEPASNSGTASARSSDKYKRKAGLTHKKNDSIASTSSSSSSQFFSEIDNGIVVSLVDTPSLEQKLLQTNLSSSSSSSSLPSLDVSVSSGATSTSTSQLNTPSKAGSLPRGVTPPSGPNGTHPSRSPDFYIIRVSLATPSKETEGINLYKSIMVSNHERTPQVIRNAMMKHGLEGHPDDYTLAQLLPKGEMMLPPNANVYYAVNTSCDLNFILRPKSESTPAVSLSANGTPARIRVRDLKDSGKDTLKARKKILSLGL